MPFTIAVPTMVPLLRWLCSLMHTSDRDLPTVAVVHVLPNRTVLARPSVIPAEAFLVGEHARQV